MSPSQRVKEIEDILRNDPRRYWSSPDLQRELRETLSLLHGEDDTSETFSGDAPSITLGELVHKQRITVMRMVELFTIGPAKILKLDRGTLKPGAHGDVTVFDTDTKWTFDVQQSYSKSRNSPFHGRRFRGGPVATIVGGNIVWNRE